MHSRRVEIRFAGSHAGFADGFVQARGALDAQRLDGATRYNAELVFEEITANIIAHGAPDGHELEVAESPLVEREAGVVLRGRSHLGGAVVVD